MIERDNLTTIKYVHSVIDLFESLLLPNRFRYQNMNGTMLSKMVWNMFLAHHCLPKVAKNCQKKAKVEFMTFWRNDSVATKGLLPLVIMNLRVAKTS